MKRSMGAVVFLVVLLAFISLSAAADNAGRIYADVRIVTPQNHFTIIAGQQLSVTVTMNPAAVGVLNRIDVWLQVGHERLGNIAVINNPQAYNQVMIQVPANASWSR